MLRNLLDSCTTITGSAPREATVQGREEDDVLWAGTMSQQQQVVVVVLEEEEEVMDYIIL